MAAVSGGSLSKEEPIILAYKCCSKKKAPDVYVCINCSGFFTRAVVNGI